MNVLREIQFYSEDICKDCENQYIDELFRYSACMNWCHELTKYVENNTIKVVNAMDGHIVYAILKCDNFKLNEFKDIMNDNKH